MNALSNDLRKRIVEYYKTISSTLSASTAQYFMEGEAIVSRLVRPWRKTGKGSETGGSQIITLCPPQGPPA